MTSDPHRNQPIRRTGAALATAKAAMILLHGRGASAEDILSLAGEMYDERVVYLAPQAAGHTLYPNSFLAPISQNEPWLSSALAKIAPSDFSSRLRHCSRFSQLPDRWPNCLTPFTRRMPAANSELSRPESGAS